MGQGQKNLAARLSQRHVNRYQMKIKLPPNFRFSPLITLASIALAVVMLFAARWQWQRYLFKQDLVATYKSNSLTAPLPLPIATQPELLPSFVYKKVYLDGQWDYEHQMIIMNQRSKYGAGYWLLTPFKPEGSDAHILVSRGFIPFADSTPESWKKYDFAPAERLEAVVQETVRHRSALSPSSTYGGSSNEAFPRKWLYADLERIAEKMPYPIHTSVYLQRLGHPPVGELPLEAVSIRVPPSTHFWYSIEWSLLALTSLVVGFLLQAFPRKKRKRSSPRAASSLSKNSLATGLYVVGIAYLSSFFMPGQAFATDRPQDVPRQAEIVEHLGGQVSLDTELLDQDGRTVRLGDFVSPGKPLIIAPVYYECPRLCTLTQEGLSEALKTVPLNFIDDFRVVSISFNPKESIEFAKQKADTYHKLLSDKPKIVPGWQFLSGSEANIQKVMSELGFGYAPDAGEFLHSAVLMVLTPDGKVSRYLYGIRFLPQDMKLALIEASDGKIGSIMDRILIYCFRYDHLEGRYTFAIMQFVRVICSGIFIALMSCLIWLRMKEKRRLAPGGST